MDKFLHEEVALEHAAGRPEALDARLDIRAPVVRQLARGRWCRQRPIVAGCEAHQHSTELHDHVLAPGQVGDPMLLSAGLCA